MGSQSSNELQWLDLMIGHQESSSSNDYQGGMSHFIQMPMSWNPN